MRVAAIYQTGPQVMLQVNTGIAMESELALRIPTHGERVSVQPISVKDSRSKRNMF